MAKLIFGCGYLGGRVARSWIEQGEQVYALTRSSEQAARLTNAGLRPIVGDVMQLESLNHLPVVETVLYAVGYDRESNQSITQLYVEGLRNALQSLSGEVGRLIYISSTGVYAQDDGSWIDEKSPCRPTREGGQACLAAEHVLAEHPLAGRSMVLRLAGIYGPGRIPRREAFQSDKAMKMPSRGYLNLIHVDDAVRAVLAAEKKAAPPGLYLVSDSQPVIRQDFYTELARRFGFPPPFFDEPDPNTPKAARALSDKRIRNRRLLDELQVELEYPSYREGLQAIVEQEKPE